VITTLVNWEMDLVDPQPIEPRRLMSLDYQVVCQQLLSALIIRVR
jgi:hypothetical protein